MAAFFAAGAQSQGALNKCEEVLDDLHNNH